MLEINVWRLAKRRTRSSLKDNPYFATVSATAPAGAPPAARHSLS